MKLYAGLDAGSELKRGGGGWAGEGQKKHKLQRLDRPVTSPALGTRGCLFTGLLVAATISDKGVSTVSYSVQVQHLNCVVYFILSGHSFWAFVRMMLPTSHFYEALSEIVANFF